MKKHPRVKAFLWPNAGWGPEYFWVVQLYDGNHMFASGFLPTREENMPSNEKIDHHIASTAG